MCALTEEARRLDKRVASHAHGTPGVLTPIAARIGERVSATVLDAVIDPPQSRLGLREWAHSVADKLGDDLVDRIRERERES